jgi:hypothetical protein
VRREGRERAIIVRVRKTESEKALGGSTKDWLADTPNSRHTGRCCHYYFTGTAIYRTIPVLSTSTCRS